MSMSSPMFRSTTRNGTGLGVPYLLPGISLVLKKYTRWSLPVSPPIVKRFLKRSHEPLSPAPKPP